MINAIGNMIGVRRGGGGSSLDPNAAALLAAMDGGGDVLPDPDRLLVNDFFVYLKDNNLYTEGKAVWILRGGTASANKWNMLNPVDSNAAFRMEFGGGVTHNANGFTPNGSSGFADTWFTPYGNHDGGLSMIIYNRSGHAGGYGPIYTEGSGGGTIYTGNDGHTTMSLYDPGNFRVKKWSDNGAGVWAVDLDIDALEQTGYKNGAAFETTSIPNPNPAGFFKVRVGAYFNGNTIGGPGEFNAANIAFLGFFKHLTPAQHLTLYNGIAALQTGFGR